MNSIQYVPTYNKYNINNKFYLNEFFNYGGKKFKKKNYNNNEIISKIYLR